MGWAYDILQGFSRIGMGFSEATVFLSSQSSFQLSLHIAYSNFVFCIYSVNLDWYILDVRWIGYFGRHSKIRTFVALLGKPEIGIYVQLLVGRCYRKDANIVI